jgi:hypothetical protein
MTLRDGGVRRGVDLHLEPEECELFMKLATDAEKAIYPASAPTYFSVCVKIGQRINSVVSQSSGWPAGRSRTTRRSL